MAKGLKKGSKAQSKNVVEETPVVEGQVMAREDTDPDEMLPVGELRRVGRLQTPGQIKSEMGKVYRAVHRGDMGSVDGRLRVGMLAQMLKAVELELEFSLRQEDPNDDRPAFAGMVIEPPKLIEGPKHNDGGNRK